MNQWGRRSEATPNPRMNADAQTATLRLLLERR